jgi:hypothetical protein
MARPVPCHTPSAEISSYFRFSGWCQEQPFGSRSPNGSIRPQTVVRGDRHDGKSCPLAVIRALAACTFKTRALTDFALFNHLIRAGAAVAGYAGPEAADFPVKLVLGYIGID